MFEVKTVVLITGSSSVGEAESASMGSAGGPQEPCAAVMVVVWSRSYRAQTSLVWGEPQTSQIPYTLSYQVFFILPRATVTAPWGPGPSSRKTSKFHVHVYPNLQLTATFIYRTPLNWSLFIQKYFKCWKVVACFCFMAWFILLIKVMMVYIFCHRYFTQLF